MTQAKTISLSDTMSMEIEALVKGGFYTSQSDIFRDAVKCLFMHQPNLKLNAAIELYKEEKISIGRAAEIAEMSTPDFVDAMAERGIKRVLNFDKKRAQKGVEIIKRFRK